MSLEGLLDHTARIWRPVVSLGVVREEIRTFIPVALADCTVRRPSARVADAGGGLVSQGERVVYFEPEVILEPRDIIELTSGPDSPGLFEVDAPVTRPRGHHIEATCRLWLGKLPPLEEGS
jgi:hypothetical protein